MLRCAITSRHLLAPDEPSRHSRLLALAATWASTGIDYIQLREKDLPASTLATLARDLLTTVRAHTPPNKSPPQLLINSRADVALAVRADGVHLTCAPGSLTPTQIRTLYSRAHLPSPTISLSCHTLDDIAAALDPARSAAPSLILFGPVFEKAVPTENLTLPGSGLDLLRAACAAAAPIPVLALGGITLENTPACLSASASGIAAIRLFSP
jgi:thiamine-phosphate pyrophosphorylase